VLAVATLPDGEAVIEVTPEDVEAMTVETLVVELLVVELVAEVVVGLT